MANVGYIRVSTNGQELSNQKLRILEHCQKEGFPIDGFVEVELSTRKSQRERRIDELVEKLKTGDTLIVTELSRLGRSVNQILWLVEVLREKGVNIIALKEHIDTSENNIATKALTTMFSLAAEIERDLLSQRTKEALARARKEGKTLGRPKGSTGKSKLDGKEQEIKELLAKGINKTAISKLLDVSRPTLYNFIETRKLES